MLSPLSRAAETGRAYTRRHPELAAVTEEWEETAEMRLGTLTLTLTLTLNPNPNANANANPIPNQLRRVG